MAHRQTHRRRRHHSKKSHRRYRTHKRGGRAFGPAQPSSPCQHYRNRLNMYNNELYQQTSDTIEDFYSEVRSFYDEVRAASCPQSLLNAIQSFENGPLKIKMDELLSA